MNRRDLLKIAGVSGLASNLGAQQHHDSLPKQPAEKELHKSYRARFFSEDEYKTLEEMCEVLLPTDADSPGARDAGVAFFLDTTLLYAKDEVKAIWKAGVAYVDGISIKLHGKPFAAITTLDRQSVFDQLAAEEASGKGKPPAFFTLFKELAIEGFCCSELGMRDYLRYRGETAIPVFPGC